jgi:hypothetical protein
MSLNTPTVKTGIGWRILNTDLGCGSRVLQGWSSGIGIAGNENFEEKLFHLLYLSKNQNHVKDKWSMHGTGISLQSPIGVSYNLWQFLENGRTYTLNSKEKWVDRFEAFVKKHNLGDFSRGHAWHNPSWNEGKNVTCTWTWNGNVPKSADVGLVNFNLPE